MLVWMHHRGKTGGIVSWGDTQLYSFRTRLFRTACFGPSTMPWLPSSASFIWKYTEERRPTELSVLNFEGGHVIYKLTLRQAALPWDSIRLDSECFLSMLNVTRQTNAANEQRGIRRFSLTSVLR